MEKVEVQNIPLDQIKPHPNNRPVGGFNQEKLEWLAESIQSVGVQQPALVREVGTNNGAAYELIAGERRWRASKIAGAPALPCIVKKNIDDAMLLKIQVIENLQRENVHPLDEAAGFSQLIDTLEYDAETIAKEIGRSPGYVYQRLKLGELIPEAKASFIEGKIHVGHAIQIARLNEFDQEEALKNLFKWGTLQSIKDFREWITQNIFSNLSTAAFPKDDADLVPNAGPCTTCAKRTGNNPHLFEELNKHDHCTDRGCLNFKIDNFLQIQKEKLAGKDHLEVCAEWENNIPEGTLGPYDWEECKKKDKGAKKALIVNGPERGKITYGRNKNDEYFKCLDDIEDPEEKAERIRQQIERDTCKRLNELVLEKLLNDEKDTEDFWDDCMKYWFIESVYYNCNYQLLEDLEIPDFDEVSEDTILEAVQDISTKQILKILKAFILQDVAPSPWGEDQENCLFYLYAREEGINLKILRMDIMKQVTKEIEQENDSSHES